MELESKKAYEYPGRTKLEKMTMEDFIKELKPIALQKLSEFPLGPKTEKLAIEFMHIMFDKGEAYRPLSDFCTLCIGNAAIYYGNCEGRDPNTY